jgi:sialic acid synthase SpsE
MAAERAIRVGDRVVSDGQPTYIIAEAGVNHRCDMELARRLIREARQAGADAIKFQTYKAETLVTRWAPRYWEDSEESGTQFAIFKESDRFGPEQYRAMADYCGEQSIDFLSTPFDHSAVTLLDDLGVSLFKIASADLTDRTLLGEIAKTGKPVVQSTGASTLDEVDAWLARARECGVDQLSLLHCVLCYPTDLDDANLRRIGLMVERFPDIVIGYSDHTDATVCCPVAVAAVAQGARIIEKHFTLDRSWPGDDHYHSADPGMLADMVAAVRTAERALGKAYEGVLPCEEQSRQYARRSVIAARDIAAGETITERDLIMKRPGTGISPTELDKIIGQKATRPIAEDAALTWDDLE